MYMYVCEACQDIAQSSLVYHGRIKLRIASLDEYNDSFHIYLITTLSC